MMPYPEWKLKGRRHFSGNSFDGTNGSGKRTTRGTLGCIADVGGDDVSPITVIHGNWSTNVSLRLVYSYTKNL